MNISLVIPTINSELIIEENVRIVKNILENHLLIDEFEIILAAQTSDDNTFEVIKTIKDVRPLFIEKRGKGVGLTHGMRAAKHNWIVMIDDDLPYDLTEFLSKAKEYIENNDILMASRYIQKIPQDIPLKRRVVSYVYRSIVRLLFSIPQKDVQAGLKMIKKSVFEKTGFPKEQGWIWDTELLYKANKLQLRIKEIPVYLLQKDNKLEVVSASTQMLKDIFRLWVKERL